MGVTADIGTEFLDIVEDIATALDVDSDPWFDWCYSDDNNTVFGHCTMHDDSLTGAEFRTLAVAYVRDWITSDNTYDRYDGPESEATMLARLDAYAATAHPGTVWLDA